MEGGELEERGEVSDGGMEEMKKKGLIVGGGVVIVLMVILVLIKGEIGITSFFEDKIERLTSFSLRSLMSERGSANSPDETYFSPTLANERAQASPKNISHQESNSTFFSSSSPTFEWRVEAPENHGMDGEKLREMHEELAQEEIMAMVTVKDGVIVDEYYKEGYGVESVMRMASVTKTFTGALVGIAIEKGLIGGVEEKIGRFFEQLNAEGQEEKREISVENLLTHTAGIYWDEWSGGDYFMRLNRSENWVEFVLGQEMASTPGEMFNYTTGGSHLLGAVIEEAVGMTEAEWGRENLFAPLGMESVTWQSDPQGVTDGGNGIAMTARDAAKFGQLYLDGGKWQGKQIIAQEWVEASVRKQAAGSYGTGEYGYGWWLKDFGGYSGYYAMGHGGQYIIVIPELKLVTVIASRVNDTYLPQRIFEEGVVGAVKR